MINDHLVKKTLK